jgi:hypothetical protein
MNEICFNNVLSLKKLFPDYNILVIDNNSNNTEYLDKLPDYELTVQKSAYGGAFEPGALLQAYNQFKAENYFLIQDSVEMFEANPVVDYVNNDYNFVLALQQFCPALHMCKEDQLIKLKQIDSKLRSYASMYPGIEFSSFVAKPHHIQTLIDKNLLIEENIPRDKNGCELWERIFGLGFYCNKIEVKSLTAKFDPIYQYSGKVPLDKLFFKSTPNDKVFKKNYFSRV